MNEVTFGKSSIWEQGDDSYDIVGYNEKTRTVIIEKEVRYGIYFDEIKKSTITRKLNKNNQISLAGIKHDLSGIHGLN